MRQRVMALMGSVLLLAGLSGVAAVHARADTPPPVAFDAASGAKVVNVSHLSWTQTVGSGTDMALLVDFTVGAVNDTGCVASVTDNGVALPLVSSVHTDNATAGELLVYGLAGPAAGANDIAASVSSCSSGTPKELTGGSESFANVNQSSPWGDVQASYGYSATPSVTASSGSANDLMAEFVSTGTWVQWANSPITAAFTENENDYTGAGNTAGGYMPATGGSQTGTWDVTNDYWGSVAVDVQSEAQPGSSQATAIPLGTLTGADQVLTASGSSSGYPNGVWYAITVPSFLPLVNMQVSGTGASLSEYDPVGGYEGSATYWNNSYNAGTVYVQVVGSSFNLTITNVVGIPTDSQKASAISLGTLTSSGGPLTATGNNPSLTPGVWYSVTVPSSLTVMMSVTTQTNGTDEAVLYDASGGVLGPTWGGSGSVSSGTAYVQVAQIGTQDAGAPFTLTLTPQ